MLEEKAVETGCLPDELDVDRGLNNDPEDLVTHYQFHEYVRIESIDRAKR